MDRIEASLELIERRALRRSARMECGGSAPLCLLSARGVLIAGRAHRRQTKRSQALYAERLVSRNPVRFLYARGCPFPDAHIMPHDG